MTVERGPAVAAARLVILSGPAGSGKTAICRLGHTAMNEVWGHAAAAVDVDRLYANVDPGWELPYDNARNHLMLTQTAGLALSLFAHGWATVLVCGNSLFDPADTATLVAGTRAADATVHHVTVLPSRSTVLARCAGDPARDAASVAADHDLHVSRIHPGSRVLDTDDLSPRQALERIAEIVGAGAARIA